MKIVTLRSLLLVFSLAALVAAGCNLLSTQSEATVTPSGTQTTTTTAQPTGSLTVSAGTLTPLPLTPFTFVPSTQVPGFPTSQLPPTAIAQIPTSTQLPINITIFSPIPGNRVAGTVSVFGSALHPQFLQYQVEYGPDPNPNNLWYPASGVTLAPVLNGVLANWNTLNTPDGIYQLRLRVTLRDGTTLSTVVNNIRVQNQAPTPVPTATRAVERPVAAFVANPPVGQAPLAVTFINRTTGVISNVTWNFGDGTTSTEINPVHTYNTPGLYTVTLNITGPGGTSNVSQQIVVQSATPPVAAFATDKTSGAPPLTVQFTDQSTGAVSAYYWNFSDGTTSSERSPSHTFNNVGTYNVILTVTGAGGSSSTTRQITVQSPSVPPPTAVISASATQVQVGVPIQFTSQSTGNIATYTWNFGDGTLSNAQNPTHTYNFPGTYPVTLIVSGPGGQNATQTQITVVLPPSATPTMTFTPTVTPTETLTATAVPPTETSLPLPTEAPTLTLTSTETPLPTDVPTSIPTETPTELPTLTPTFTETSTEVPTLTLTFTETPLPTDVPTSIPTETPTELPTLTPTFTEAPTETPLPAAPAAAFTSDVTEGDAPLTVQFTNQSAGDITDFNWNFGDGTESTEVNPSHTYNAPGVYTVTLFVSGPGGDSTSQTAITVNQPTAPPVAAFTTDVTEGDTPLTVQFTNQSTGDITSYIWNFGDGTESTEVNPSHTYNAPGVYTVTLFVSGPGGDSTSQTAITVNQPTAPPVAAFTTDVTQGDAPLTVNFDSSTSTGDITSYIWDFGDGGSSTDANPSYTYTTAGTYTVTLTVSGAGGSNSAQATINVNESVAAPVAAFTTDVTQGDAPLTVNFDSSTSTGDITSYIWDFGDGGSSTDANPSYTYTTTGTYTVTLTVSGAGGESTAEAVITVNEPIATLPQPGLAETTPILSDLSALQGALRSIYEAGAARGNQPAAFSIVGDDLALQPGLLAPFNNADNVTLDDSTSNLQSIIDWYNLLNLGGQTNFNRRGPAVSSGWTAADLLNPANTNPNCTGGESPFACELRLLQPGVVIISIGFNDILQQTDPAAFSASLDQLVQLAIDNGTIPVLMTLPANSQISGDPLRAINDAIIEVANERNVPVVNLWRAFNELPEGGLQSDRVTPSVSPSGPVDLTSAAISTYGYNAANFYTLTLLNDLRNMLFPDAPPPV